MRFKSMINVVLKTILSNSCTHLERCTNSIGKPGNTLNIFCSKGLRKGFMARGGFREGAGRKKEYNEPVKKILYPFRQIAIRTRCLHRLSPQEMLIRKGI